MEWWSSRRFGLTQFCSGFELAHQRERLRRCLPLPRLPAPSCEISKLTASLSVLRFPPMTTDHIVALLIAERDKINRAIEALQGSVKRRGRSPKSASLSAVAPATASILSDANEAAPRKKRHVSAAARKKMAAAQKKRWAAIKAGK
jgi:hypothetical protein